MVEVIEQMKKLSRAELRRLERESKKTQGRYYTNEQIAQIRAEARSSYMKEVQAEYEKLIAQDKMKLEAYRKECDRQSEEYFEHLRQRFHSGDKIDEYVSHLIAYMSMAAAVLVEDFGWKPLHGNGRDNSMKMNRFLEGCVKRINDIGADPNMDIELYCKQIADKYCVGLVENVNEVLEDARDKGQEE